MSQAPTKASEKKKEDDVDSVITSRVNTKDDIYDSIKTFFARGK